MDILDPCSYLRDMKWDEEIDAIGLLCPLPVLRTRKRIGPMASGTIVRVLTTDPAALIDLPHFCNEAGHAYLGSEENESWTAHFVKKA